VSEGVINKLKNARDKLADCYEEEATDDLRDNGNLISIHEAILSIENAISLIEKRD